jgi:WD40 repeat protein
MTCHGCEINDIAFGCRKTFITGGADSVVKVFDLERSKGRLSNAEDPRHAVVQDSKHAFTCGGPVISVHSAGEHVAGACSDGIARIWNVRTGKLRQSLSGHANKVTSVRLVGKEKQKKACHNDLLLLLQPLLLKLLLLLQLLLSLSLPMLFLPYMFVLFRFVQFLF